MFQQALQFFRDKLGAQKNILLGESNFIVQDNNQNRSMIMLASYAKSQNGAIFQPHL